MTGRDNRLWLQMWRDKSIDFHQSAVNPLLSRFWSVMEHRRGSRVFVPLCGKSLDMIWLAQQGHEVIGVELSPVAVKAFFKENHLHPEKQRIGTFTRWRHGRISILCGDYFVLDKKVLGRIDTVYDRAALTALPEDMRLLYVAHQQTIMPDASNVFLLTIEDSAGPGRAGSAPQIDAEVAALYAAGFDINLLHVERVFETDAAMPAAAPRQADYKVYRLSSKPRLV
jgi:thiopurine S-methyltransferase